MVSKLPVVILFSTVGIDGSVISEVPAFGPQPGRSALRLAPARCLS